MKKGNNKKRKIGIVFIILIVSIIALCIVLVLLKNNKGNNEITAPYELSEAEKLLVYYRCKNISIIDSSESNFKKDIYLIFGEDLWNGDNSNEGYFSNIIIYLTDIFDYENFRMIDSSRELVIAVTYDKENKRTKSIFINGEVNYFQKESAKKTAEKKFEKIEQTDFEINSKEILDLIKNKWETDGIDFGTVESRFDDYDIYFDEGIKVKSIGGKVFNIVFTEKYTDKIVNNLKSTASKKSIIESLGEPTFDSDKTFGYKGKNIYIFFSERDVSVYRVEDEYKENEFIELVNEFKETKSIKKFIDSIKKLWKDYDEYLYDSTWASLKYTLKGIIIEFNTNGENGLKLYNNFNCSIQDGLKLEDITENNLPENVYLYTKQDLVFLYEIKRVGYISSIHSAEFIEMQDEPGATQKSATAETKKYKFTDKKSENFDILYSYTKDEGIYGVKFVSKTGKYPDSELIRHKQIYTYGWKDDDVFIYSVKSEGIYSYNAKTRQIDKIIEGAGDFYIKGLNENVLIYDNAKINLK